jgi:hypothetical protein
MMMNNKELKTKVKEYLNKCSLYNVKEIYLQGIHNVTNQFNNDNELYDKYKEEFYNQSYKILGLAIIETLYYEE